MSSLISSLAAPRPVDGYVWKDCWRTGRQRPRQNTTLICWKPGVAVVNRTTMPPSKYPMPPKYEVRLRKTTRKGWQGICARDPQGAQEVLQFLRTTPARRVPGKVKKLKGKLKGLLQYDVNYSDRVQYWLDKENNVVWVEYAGPHP